MIDIGVLRGEAAALEAQVIANRRALHQAPELSGLEVNTQAFLLRALEKLGLEITTYPGMTCVVALLRGAKEGPCVGIRADMDALPVKEKTGLPFASHVDGVMHACGHDAHMAIALGVATLLAAHRGELQGSVKFLFEHAEETTGGAKEMIAAGCMENPHVDAMLGLHMLPSQKAGTILTKPGAVSGSSTDITFDVYGHGCHGAYPERGADAIVIASQVVCALQTVVSRNVSPLDSVVLTLGQISGGTAGNVVCDHVQLKGTLRALSPHTQVLCLERMQSVASGIASSMGGSATLTALDSYAALSNDASLHALFESTAAKIIGTDQIIQREKPSMGVESFSFFVENTPGLYYDLGCGVGAALHCCDFVVDESCLATGVLLNSAMALAMLDKLK